MEAHKRDKACFFLEIPEYKRPTPGIIIHTKAEATPIQAMLARSNWAFKSTFMMSPPVPVPVKPESSEEDIFTIVLVSDGYCYCKFYREDNKRKKERKKLQLQLRWPIGGNSVFIYGDARLLKHLRLEPDLAWSHCKPDCVFGCSAYFHFAL